jgi:hypothetical protein
MNIPGGPNMNEIFKMAQQVASQMSPGDKNLDPSNMDMGKMIQEVTKSVTKIVTPEFVEKMSKNPSSDNPVNLSPRKHSKKVQIQEVDDCDEDCDPIALRTKDIHFTMNVTLEDLYNGKKKKLSVRRQVLQSDGSLVEEKKKIQVLLEKGMIDEQVIRFNKLADEKRGYETGDIVITLCLAENNTFERDGNNLIIEKEISLYESYNPVIYINHLDDRVIKISGERMDLFGEDFDTFKKVSSEGMPIYGEGNKFGDLFVRFKCVLPKNFDEEKMSVLENLFPKINNEPSLGSSTNIVEKTFELVTESDLEFLDDSSDDYDSESCSDSDMSEYSSENLLEECD